MRRFASLIALSTILPPLCGCLTPPNLAHPGTEAQQQSRSQIFETYPDNDLGPPVVGGRPREYQEPRAEVTRALQRPEPGLAPAPVPAPTIVYPYSSQGALAPADQPPIITPPPTMMYIPPGMTQPGGNEPGQTTP
jgi:hypothetical protein